jgi:glycosyltransferase involved in cell wall biosynthesis
MRLSLCIATFNRGRFIGETLDSFVRRLPEGVEVVVVDGASTDDTRQIMAGYTARYPAIRYFREAANSGVDADYDKAVAYATGDYCWLFADDDLIAPGAIERVLSALECGRVDLLLVDAEIRDWSLARTLRTGRLGFKDERTYDAGDASHFLADTGDALSFIGGVIICRDIWNERQRTPYFGSLFIHVGVIFQSPTVGRIKVIPAPLVIIRAGNGMWRPRSFEIWAFKWPALIWSFDGLSDRSKSRVTPREPWRKLTWLMAFRAMGAYSPAEYKTYFADKRVGFRGRFRLIAAAAFPGRLANFLNVVLLALVGQGGGDATYELVTCSRYANPASQFVASIWLKELTRPSAAELR